VGYMPENFPVSRFNRRGKPEVLHNLGTTIDEENYDIIKDIYIQIAPFKIDVLENFQAE
jgi:hypothetical protein